MGYAWAPQIKGLVRGEPEPGQRHRANGKAMLMEGMEERASKSPTLDRSRSGDNTYWHRDEDAVSGTRTWDAMCADADRYKVPVKLKNGKTAERGLPHNAVIGWAMIIKPPPDMVAALGMSDADIRDFCADGWAAMKKIESRLFRDETMRAFSMQRDEDATHCHFFGDSKNKDGKYCGNLIDARLCVRICEAWPKLMREKKWPIDDLDMTDWTRMGDKTDEDGNKILGEDGKPIPIDPEYRAEREAKRKRQGLPVSEYAKQKASDALQTAAQIIKDARDDAKTVRDSADEYAQEVRSAAAKDVEEQEQAAQTAQETLSALQLQIEDRESELQELEEDKKDAADALERLRRTTAKEHDAREQKRKAAEEQGYRDGYAAGVQAGAASPTGQINAMLRRRQEEEDAADPEEEADDFLISRK